RRAVAAVPGTAQCQCPGHRRLRAVGPKPRCLPRSPGAELGVVSDAAHPMAGGRGRTAASGPPRRFQARWRPQNGTFPRRGRAPASQCHHRPLLHGRTRLRS
ncbi:unnamed protein product, partial [Phaeothamnion confervicola]